MTRKLILAVALACGGLPASAAAQRSYATQEQQVPLCQWKCVYEINSETHNPQGRACIIDVDFQFQDHGVNCIVTGWDCSLIDPCPPGGYALMQSNGDVLAVGSGCVRQALLERSPQGRWRGGGTASDVVAFHPRMWVGKSDLGS